MKLRSSILLMLLSIHAWGENNLPPHVSVNGLPFSKGAFLFFPMTNDTITLDNLDLLALLKQKSGYRLFYCVSDDKKSRIYDLDSDTIENSAIDFKIPDSSFYYELYKTKICPFCHKSDHVIPLVYGKPSSKAIKLADKGEIKLAGCLYSSTSPRLYCKTDNLEF